MAVFMITGLVSPEVYAADDPVAAVTAQLEAIDSLQEMQNKRSEYKASANYDANDPAIVDMMTLYQTFVPAEAFAPSKQYHGKLAVDEKRQKWAYFDGGITLVNHNSLWLNSANLDLLFFHRLPPICRPNRSD